MPYLALSPVAAALYAKLNVAALQALVGSRLYEDVPQAPTYPFVWIESSERDLRMFGSAFPEIEVRIHAFSAYEGMKEAQDIIAKVIELLRDQSLGAITGYTQAGKVFYDETVLLLDELVNGVKVRRLVAMFRVYVQEA